MDIRKIIQEEVRKIFMEGKSKSFFSKLRKLMAPDGNISKHFKTKKIDGWPDVPSDGDDSIGSLDLENNEFVSLDKNKLTLITGGDWQEAWIVEIGNSSGGLKVLNYRLPKKGEYKKLTKKGSRMSEDEITEVMYSDHSMHKSFENFIKEVKSGLRGYKPWGNSYGDDQYEESLEDGPKFDKYESIVHMTWYIGGHENSIEKIKGREDLDYTHEEKVEERFQKWVKNRFWNSKGDKVRIKNKEYKIKCYSESLGDDRVRFSIVFKEKDSDIKNIVKESFESILEGKKKKPKKRNTFKKLQDNKVALTKEERAEVMKKKAVWHHGPGGSESSAVWKSKDPKTGKFTFVTHTHRAYNTASTLKGAIGRFHDFIKGTS